MIVIVKKPKTTKKRKTVFILTVMSRDANGERRKDSTGHVIEDRTLAWYSSRRVAERHVLGNATDMFECGYYNIAVIEEMPEMILGFAKNRWWFGAKYKVTKRDHVTTVKKRSEPEWAKGICNYGIG